MANNSKLYRNPDPVVPGRKYDWQGIEGTSEEKIYKLLRKIEVGKLEFVPDGAFDIFFTSTPNDLSGMIGMHINDTDVTDALPLGITFETDGNQEWEIGMDFTITNGRRDFVSLYDATANSAVGADIIRASHEADSDDSATPKIAMGRALGTPRAQNYFLMLDGGDDTTELGGLLIRHFGGSTANGISIVNRATANNRSAMSFGDALETFWVMGSDLAAANDKHFYWFDAVNSQTRMFIKSVSGNLPATGFGTTNPQGLVSAGGSSAAAQYNVRQRYFIGSTTDDPGSRSVNIEAIRDATVGNTVNYVWLMGGMGGGSTAATRVATSSGSSLGLEGTDTVLSVVVAGTGSNQTIQRPLQFSNAGAITLNFDTTLADGVDLILNTSTGSAIGTSSSQKLAFYGQTPSVRPSAYTQNFTTTTRTVNAYTTDAESGAYTGIDNLQVGTPYAQLTDLNSLRVAYENLRASYDNLLSVTTQILDDMQTIGLLA